MDLRQRIAELRAEPQPTGKPIGIYPLIDRLKAEGYEFTHNEIRRILGIGAFGDRPEETPVSIVPPSLERPKRRTAYTDAKEAFFDWIGKDTSEETNPPSCSSEDASALISDVHAPFHDKDKLRQFVREAHAAGCWDLIIGGDGEDFYALSRYHKSKQIRFEHELAALRVHYEYLASEFASIKIVDGNHGAGRFNRVLAEMVSEEIRFLVRDPYDVLLADLPNIQRVGHNAPFGNRMGWLYQHGKDCVITHCEASSAQQGKNLTDLKNWIREWGPVLGITSSPRLITSGHTHRLTELHDHDCKLIETGNLASWDIQAYQFEQAGIRNRKPGVPGWTLIVQRDGVTDLKESRAIRLRA